MIPATIPGILGILSSRWARFLPLRCPEAAFSFTAGGRFGLGGIRRPVKIVVREKKK